MESTQNALPVVYEQNEATLTAAVEQSRGLRIDGPEDRKGYAAVHAARMRLKGYRTSIEATRKDLKAGALEYGRRVDAEAKRLTAIVEPTELELEAEQKRVDAERERIKAEAEAARKAQLDERVAAFTALGYTVAPSVVAELSEADYQDALAVAQAEHAAQRERERVEAEAKAREQAAAQAAIEAQRKADEEARRVERERLAAERAELERMRAEQARQDEIRRAEQAAAQAKLDAERRALEEERAAIVAASAKAARAVAPEPEPAPLFPEVSEAGPVSLDAVRAEVLAECDAEDEAEAVAYACALNMNAIDMKAAVRRATAIITCRPKISNEEASTLGAIALGYLAGVAAERARRGA